MKNLKSYFLFILNLALVGISHPLWANDFGAFADVDPGSNLGIVQVEAPGIAPQILEQFKIVLETKPSIINSTEFSKPYKVEEQDFCLLTQATSVISLGTRFCGFKVKRGEKTIITLASLVTTSKDTYTIDIVPLMSFTVIIKPTATAQES